MNKVNKSFFFKLLVNKLLAFQLIFVYPFYNANASGLKDKIDFGQRMKDSVQTEVTDFLCERAIGGEGESTAQDIGCKAVGIAAGKSPEVMEALVNMLLIMSMSVSLINSDCKVTDAGKKYLPKSHTAGITHWIHKLASLIYIYAELQNLIALRELKGKYDERSKQGGQAEKFRTLVALQEEKIEALEKKREILEISTLGFGAAGAVELGLSAGMSVWGTVKSARETMECNVKTITSNTCGVPGGASAGVQANVTAGVGRIATNCTAKYTKDNLVGSLIGEAKTQVKGRLMSAIGRAVGGQLTQALGGGSGAQIVGEAAGSVLGQKYGGKAADKASAGVGKAGTAVLGEEASQKVGGYVTKSLKESSQDGINLQDPSGQLQKCVKDKTQKEVTGAVKKYATAAALDSCAGTMGASCAVAATANCALQVAWAKEGCNCALRNIKDTKDVAKFLKDNTDLPTELTTNPKLLSRMAASIKNDERYYGEGVDDEDLVCGVDYSGWAVRHDLECRPAFSFLRDEEPKEKSQEDLAREDGEEEAPRIAGAGEEDPAVAGASEDKPTVSGNGDYIINTIDLGDKICKEYINSETGVIEKSVCEGEEGYADSQAETASPEETQGESPANNELDSSAEVSSSSGREDFSTCINGEGRVVDGEVYCTSGVADPNQRELADDEARNTSVRLEGDERCTYVNGAKVGCQKINKEADRENSRNDSQRSAMVIEERTRKRLADECGSREKEDWQECHDRVKEEETQKWYQPEASINPALQKIQKELRYIESFKKEKAQSIYVGLSSTTPEKWAELFLNDQGLIEEYRAMDSENKGQVNKALEFLSRALIKLSEQVVPSAHAEDTDQFVSSTEEGSLLGGLGITGLGVLLFPKYIKRFMGYTTVLQRAPIRRGVFYTTSYFLANENVKSTKKRINKTKDNLKKIKEVMEKNGMSLTTPVEENAGAFLRNFMQAFTLPNAIASAGQPRVPLCIENGGFSTSCVCHSRGGCGNEITKRAYRSELLGIKAIKDIFSTQLSFSRKMARGQVTDTDYTHYKNTLDSQSKKVDPAIASQNLDRILKDSGMPALDVFEKARRFTASIKRSAVQEAYEAAGEKFDPRQHDFSSDTFGEEDRASDGATSGQESKANKGEPKDNKDLIKKKTAAFEPKSEREEESLSNFALNMNDINKNKELDIFKIIQRRYQEYYMRGELLEEDSADSP